MKFKFLSLILISSLFSCDTKTQKLMPELPKAPFAKQIPKKLTIHDDVRVDEFYAGSSGFWPPFPASDFPIKTTSEQS